MKKFYQLLVVSAIILVIVYYVLFNINLQSWKPLKAIAAQDIPSMQELPVSIESHQNGTLEKKTLLTIFTSFKENVERNFVENNTVVNWASLGEMVQPIAFANSDNNSEFATSKGWIWLPLQRTNSFGTPFLKDMYRKASEVSKSHFYGFCNGDILFDQSLIKTLEVVRENLMILNLTTLLIGRRMNVDIKKAHSQLALQNYTLLKGLSKAYGRLFSSDAEDFFIMSYPWGFPWHIIKDVVIGRPAYDNYLVGQALHAGVSVIDATKTVLAFHQTGSDGIRAGAHNKDSGYNKRIIGRYRYNSGITTAAQYYTKHDSSGNVTIVARPKPKPKPKLPKPTDKTDFKSNDQPKTRT